MLSANQMIHITRTYGPPSLCVIMLYKRIKVPQQTKLK